MIIRGESIRVMHPLFPSGNEGGSIPTSPLSMRVERINYLTANELNRKWRDEHGRPRAKLWGLRMLDPAIFTRLPLAFADSTNAVRNANLPRFGIYAAPNLSTRMSIIAERIEAHQSAAVWVSRAEQKVLVYG